MPYPKSIQLKRLYLPDKSIITLISWVVTDSYDLKYFWMKLIEYEIPINHLKLRFWIEAVDEPATRELNQDHIVRGEY